MKKLVKNKLLPAFLVLVIIASFAGGAWLIFHKVNTSVQQVADTSRLSTTDPDLKLTEIVAGLNNPVSVVFPNQSAIFYAVSSGAIHGRLPATNEDWIITTPGDIKNTDGFGLMSLLADKEFSENRYIYTCYATATDLRVVRYETSKDLKSIVNTKVIVSGIEVRASKDASCALAMDAAGTVWVGTGDSGITTAPQNPKSLAGKILRINREGTSVGGNQKAPYDERIFSYGHRKVTSIVLIGKLLENSAYGYSIDQGITKDEVNYLKPGNFGYDPSADVNEMTNKSKYADAVEPVWTSGDKSIGLKSAVYVRPEKWQAWQNKMLVTATLSSESRLIEFDEKGAFKSEKTVMKDKYGKLNELFDSPDGTIYGITDKGNPDRIIQLKVVCTVCG